MVKQVRVFGNIFRDIVTRNGWSTGKTRAEWYQATMTEEQALALLAELEAEGTEHNLAVRPVGA